MITMEGIAVSPGIAFGKAFLLEKEDFAIKKRYIEKEKVPFELRRLKKACENIEKNLRETQDKISQSLGIKRAQIFAVHSFLLKDPLFMGEIKKRIKENFFGAEYSIFVVTEELERSFRVIDDPYLKERIRDIKDVSRRILASLLGKEKEILSHLSEKVIVVSIDIAPSDTAQMRKEKVIAFATEMGSRTSHTAIMARSLEIPAVVGVKEISARVNAGNFLIIDGNSGKVIIDPDKETIAWYKQAKRNFALAEKKLVFLRRLPAKTTDGYEIPLSANIEVPEEVPSVLKHGAGGIGLYRTEFLYLNRADLPSEEEQFAVYQKVARQISPYPVTIRTLDLGGDKFLSPLNLPPELNPSLGCRAIRFCLERPEIFKVQLRAILRASVYENLRVMYPLITGIEEIKKANAILNALKEELFSKDIPFNKNLKVGIMIEVPSAALIADLLAKEVDFFSIGTNDLIQYALAIDRVNERIAYLYQPLHPGILRLIRQIVNSGHHHKIKVSMCGEMAGDALYTPILLGLGLDELSMGAISIPEVKKVIQNMSIEEARKLSRQALTLSSASEVKDLLGVSRGQVFTCHTK